MATSKSTSSKKPTAPKRTSPKAAEAGVNPETAAEGDEAAAEVQGEALKKKDLLARVRARATGVKGREVRVVLDAVLEELAVTLVEGNGVSALPLGSLKVQKRRALSGADVVVCKLRRKKRTGGDTDPLAEAAE